MPPARPPLPPPPPPTRQIFDPFNSSSTGHQTGTNRLSGSTSWRNSRTHKLAEQFRDRTGGGGASHLSHLVGPGSASFGLDGRKGNGEWERDAPGLRQDGWQDIREMMQRERKRGGDERACTSKEVAIGREDGRSQVTGEGLRSWQGRLSTDKTLISTAKGDPHVKRTGEEFLSTITTAAAATEPEVPNDLDLQTSLSSRKRPPQVFSGLNIYLNGSTLPHISDHKLKHLLTQHGANISIAFGRRTVTHVILGDRGGLAAGKMQKEVARTGGHGVKFVGVRWALESMEKGKRQPESQYEVVRLAMKGQRSVLGMAKAAKAEKDRHNDDTTTTHDFMPRAT